ncbi:MAG: DEAD/DEAH box helicase [Bacteroidota bacterium]
MRTTFGNTWWGKRWLDALADIDYSNRLPRGRTYARNGAVEELSIRYNRITAKVQGRRWMRYEVEIHLPKLEAHQKKAITELINQNPYYLSQLLHNELPQELDEACQSIGISLFPRSWRDLHGDCSCPDSAVPCKHLAAVLYLVANEIDKNPFLVFSLRSFNLQHQIRKAHTQGQPSVKASIPQLKNLWQPFTAERTPPAPPADWLRQVDFTQIPDCLNDLMQLLRPKPLFYPSSDFKVQYGKALKRAARLLEKQLGQSQGTTELPAKIWAVSSIDLLLDQEAFFLQASLRNQQEEVLFLFEDKDEFCEWLAQLPPGRLADVSPPLQSLCLCRQLADQLIVKQAIFPQLINDKKDQYHIRWLPARLNEVVSQLLDLFQKSLDTQLLFYVVGKEVCEPIDGQALNDLLSFFIDQRLHQLLEHETRFPDDAIHRLFFRGYAESFGHFENKSHPLAIHLWINQFFVDERPFVPVLQLEEAPEGFWISIGVEERGKPNQVPIPLKALFLKSAHQTIRLDILRDLALLVDFLPGLDLILQSQGRESWLIDWEELPNFLMETLPLVRLFGIKVLLPKALQKLTRPQARLTVEAEESGSVAQSLFSLGDMLNFQWQIAIGDELLSVQEFIKMVRKYSGIVRLKDQFVFFNEQEIEQLIQKIKTPPSLGPMEMLQASLSEKYGQTPIQLSPEAREQLRQLLSIDRIAPPSSLLAQLRPYQQNGFEWLYKNARLGVGSIIADDMGLGKTLQVISLLLQLREEGAFQKDKGLIIVPTTLLTNWRQEIQRFAPELSTHTYHGPKRSLDGLADADLLLTTYGVVRSDQAKLKKRKWLTVVIDEAQAIKNPATAQAKSIKAIAAPIKIAMSGTPVENSLSEYWSIFDFSLQGYLGSLSSFKKQFARPIELERDQECLDQFLRITQPFILRRVKTDKSIISDLPDKIEQDQFCFLSKEQASLYQNIVEQSWQQIESSEGIQRKGLVLKLITSLKQTCNHPRQFLKKGASGPEQSGKSLRLLELMRDILDQKEKMLIFTQYQEMGRLLVDMIQSEFGIRPDFLHGGVRRKNRDQMVDQFQQGLSAPVLILSLKAGGTGLNLTAANHVIHYDLWWNPAVENQATDRVFRIGQTRNVQVHRLICSGTFEEKINALLQRKKELADLTVSTGEKWIGDLGDQELGNLLKLE